MCDLAVNLVNDDEMTLKMTQFVATFHQFLLSKKLKVSLLFKESLSWTWGQARLSVMSFKMPQAFGRKRETGATKTYSVLVITTVTPIKNAHYCLQYVVYPVKNTQISEHNLLVFPFLRSQEFAAGRMTTQRLIVHYVGRSVGSHLVPVMIMASRS